ncbi:MULTISPECIES: hypothetical protein [Marisediminitalea]|jgi:hypothetical protein|uniref:hypothetical protein n=1 Tax=Marisediminitalea TaxID=2662254 RepID=UPI0020CE2A05|nr:hypothetical protein [Marisediminitalea aggregata]MCP3863932.1 hypothetical protein [Aestuariibacter sp.]MCP4525134.1 hypothetical protein [Aestuariibacter sp.]MCP4946526.1 hypothetical protein [Aestuariibacter sp.]MCP9476403.1 hypothetical protein [Marisediminitalea aggregata]
MSALFTGSTIKKLSAVCSSGVLLVLSGCTVSYDPIANNELEEPVCVAVATRKLNCPNEPYAGSNFDSHNEAHQQMLPMEQREEILRSELETLNRTH